MVITMSEIIEMFSYPFALRAIIAGVLISLCGALLGVNLVLKRFSMLGDGLSHVAFGAAAVALAMGTAPLRVSIPVVVIAAFALLRLRDSGKMRGDAAIALVSSGSLAIGIIVASLTTGMNTDINNYMFGSILALSKGDVAAAALVAAAVMLLYCLFYRNIFACTFDEGFARASGVRVGFYNSLIAVLTAVTVVIGMRIMGALLISSVMTFPALSSMRVCKQYKTTVITSAAVSVAAFIAGLLLSFAYDMPAGASVVAVNLVIFIVMAIIGKIKEK